jgi:hypothetical protein
LLLKSQLENGGMCGPARNSGRADGIRCCMKLLLYQAVDGMEQAF